MADERAPWPQQPSTEFSGPPSVERRLQNIETLLARLVLLTTERTKSLANMFEIGPLVALADRPLAVEGEGYGDDQPATSVDT